MKVVSADRDTNSRKMGGPGRLARRILRYEEVGERTRKKCTKEREFLMFILLAFIGTSAFLAALEQECLFDLRISVYSYPAFYLNSPNPSSPSLLQKNPISDHKQRTCQTAPPAESAILSMTTFIVISNLDVYVWISPLRPTNRAPGMTQRRGRRRPKSPSIRRKEQGRRGE